jgi:hypothetical protein
VEGVAAVLADFGLQRGPLAAARAFLVAAWHPKDAPYEEDYHEKHDDDRNRHPNLASVGFKPGTERTIAARIGRVARGMPIAVIRALGGEPPGGGGDQSRAGDDERDDLDAEQGIPAFDRRAASLNSARFGGVLRARWMRLDATAPDMADAFLTREARVREAYAAHAGELYGFALRSLEDRGLAEEAVQDTFVRPNKEART